MEIMTTKQAIASQIQNFDVEDSIGLCFYNGVLDTSFVVAARQAGYLCDKLVVVNLAQKFSQTQLSILKRMNVDLLFEPQDENFKVQAFLKEGSKKLAIIMASFFQFMPLAVSVSENDIPLIQILKSLQADFGEVFELIVKQTPEHLLNVTQRQIRLAVLPCLENIQSGETEVDVLRPILKHGIEEQGMHFVQAHFYDADTFEECFGVVSPTCYVSIECVHDGQNVKDIFTLSDL